MRALRILARGAEIEDLKPIGEFRPRHHHLRAKHRVLKQRALGRRPLVLVRGDDQRLCGVRLQVHGRHRPVRLGHFHLLLKLQRGQVQSRAFLERQLLKIDFIVVRCSVNHLDSNHQRKQYKNSHQQKKIKRKKNMKKILFSLNW